MRRNLYRLRTRLKHWSQEKDRDFHDAHFFAQEFDPFTLAYPGYITIRRFADLVSPYLSGLKSVLDVGCGTAEITCELARRSPDISFMGMDHSQAGLEKAKQNAARLGLKNIEFLVANAGEFTPDEEFDVVLLFDSFHHLLDPAAFVKRLRDVSTRFLLIEPRGDWKGTWKKELDFDWLLLELDKIRSRLDYLITPPGTPRVKSSFRDAAKGSEPVEHRYTQRDFYNFFPGYGIQIRGTISGIEVYPPEPWHSGPGWERFGKIAYSLFKEVDESLLAADLDLLAKHWVIFAEKGKIAKKRKPPRKVPSAWSGQPVKGPYDVKYLECHCPPTASAGEEFKAHIHMQNRSFRVWSSTASEGPDFLSYHWFDHKGNKVEWDGLRSPLTKTLNPDEEIQVEMTVSSPRNPGSYMLHIDMVREGITWFSEAGSPEFQIPVHIED